MILWEAVPKQVQSSKKGQRKVEYFCTIGAKAAKLGGATPEGPPAQRLVLVMQRANERKNDTPQFWRNEKKKINIRSKRREFQSMQSYGESQK